MRKYLLLVISIVLAAIVFGFLCYSHPWLMTAREQSQLWMCTIDYLGFRLSEPGGAARYVAEFIVQFSYYILWGAIVIALFAFAMIWLWWLVIRRIWYYYRETPCLLWLQIVSLIPLIGLWLALLDINVQMTLPVSVCLILLLSLLIPRQGVAVFPITIILVLLGWWLAGPVCMLLPLFAPWVLWCHPRPSIAKGVLRFALLAILLTGSILLYGPYSDRPLRELFKGIDYKVKDEYLGIEEEQKYDLFVHLGLWERILAESRQTPPRKRSSYWAIQLAQWQLTDSGESDLRQCIFDTWGSLSSCSSSFLMSDVYLKLGWVNMSQRAAYEALVSFPNYNYSGRALKRLTETSLITGRYELVRKYASLLLQAPFYRSWAQEALHMVDHPELIEQNVNCKNLRQTYFGTRDALFY